MSLELNSDSEQNEPMTHGAYYSPDRDGTILDYLSNHEVEDTPRAFKTFDHFQSLLKLGIIEEGVIIRLYYSGGTDKSYNILDGGEDCEGLRANVHGGKKGIHKIKNILNEEGFRHWEISSINPKYLRR